MGTTNHTLLNRAPAFAAVAGASVASLRLVETHKKTSPEGDVLGRVMTWFTRPAIGRLPTDLNRMYQPGYQPDIARSLLATDYH